MCAGSGRFDPWWTRTPLIEGNHPLKRVRTAHDIATAAAYLASAQWTTGTILAVDGGRTIR